MTVYADTSALMKLLVPEAGTAEMQALARSGEPLFSASIAYVELRAATAAAIRDQRIGPSQRNVAVDNLERLWEQISRVPMIDSVLRRAGDLAEQMALRGYDAVHLAALQETGSPVHVIFACWDGELRTAAQQLGYTLIPA